MVNYILYVDDDPDDAGLFSEVINTIYPSIIVTTVETGREALDIMVKHLLHEIPSYLIML
jgi:hypothetical protein